MHAFYKVDRKKKVYILNSLHLEHDHGNPTIGSDKKPDMLALKIVDESSRTTSPEKVPNMSVSQAADLDGIFKILEGGHASKGCENGILIE